MYLLCIGFHDSEQHRPYETALAVRSM